MSLEKPLILTPEVPIDFKNPWPRGELEPQGVEFVSIEARIPIGVRSAIEEVLPMQGGLQNTLNHLIRILLDAKNRYGIKDYNDKRAFQLLLTRGELLLPGGSPTAASAGTTTTATISPTGDMGCPTPGADKTPRGVHRGRTPGPHPAIAQRKSERSNVPSGHIAGPASGKAHGKKGKD